MAPTPALKKPAPKDWHPADVLAAVRKAEWSLAQLGVVHGYTHRNSLSRALHTPYPKAEKIIADALGLNPWDIWPSRYDGNGQSNRPKGRKPMRPAHLQLVKPTTRKKGGNPQHRAGE